MVEIMRDEAALRGHFAVSLHSLGCMIADARGLASRNAAAKLGDMGKVAAYLDYRGAGWPPPEEMP